MTNRPFLDPGFGVGREGLIRLRVSGDQRLSTMGTSRPGPWVTVVDLPQVSRTWFALCEMGELDQVASRTMIPLRGFKS